MSRLIDLKTMTTKKFIAGLTYETLVKHETLIPTG